MFDPAKDAEPFQVKRCVRFWVEHCIFGIPVAQVAHSWRLDPIEAGEEIIRGANEAARYPTMTRCETIRTWIALATCGKADNLAIAKKHARRLFDYYDQKVLFDFLHTEHHFSMHDILEMFRPND